MILFFAMEPRINVYFQTVKSDLETYARWGDWMGGVIGTLFSFIALGFVAATYFSQRSELKATREQIKNQKFETTFFSMLNMLNTIGKEIECRDGNIGNVRGLEFYKYFMDQMRKCEFSKSEEIPDNAIVFINTSFRIHSIENKI
jgi:hypothetical protein